MLAEVIEKSGEREDVGGTACQAHDDAGDDERRLEDVLEAEYGEAEISKHARLRDKGECAEELLHGDSGHRREIVVRVVRHDDTRE